MSYSGSQTRACLHDLGKQYNNGPQQYQVFDNSAAFGLAVLAKTRIQLGWRVGVEGGLIHPTGGGGGGGGGEKKKKERSRRRE